MWMYDLHLLKLISRCQRVMFNRAHRNQKEKLRLTMHYRQDTIWRDVELMNVTWEVVCFKAVDREEWKEWASDVLVTGWTELPS